MMTRLLEPGQAQAVCVLLHREGAAHGDPHCTVSPQIFPLHAVLLGTQLQTFSLQVLGCVHVPQLTIWPQLFITSPQFFPAQAVSFGTQPWPQACGTPPPPQVSGDVQLPQLTFWPQL